MEPPKPSPEQNPEQPAAATPETVQPMPASEPLASTPPNEPAAPMAPVVPETPAAVSSVPDPAAPSSFGGSSWQPQAVVGGADQPPVAVNPAPVPMASAPMPGGGKKRWAVPAIVAIALLVVLGGGYVFAFYLPNRPSAIYAASLDKSGKAVDALVQYGDSVAAKNYKSSTFSGTLHVKTSSVSFDASLNGMYDQNANATATLNADVLGQKVGVNVRSVRDTSNTSPDVYLQLSGVKPTLDSLGLSSLDTLDGQWLSVDHTLIDTVAANATQTSAASDLATAKFPTTAQVEDAVSKVQTVNKQYIFTTNSKTAVLKQSSFVGKETKDGRNMYHYKVGYNKTNLQAYVNSLGTALNSSSLNTWAKTVNDGKDISASLKGLHDSINNAKANYTFDVWVDAKTKLIHSIQFVDPSDQSVLTLSQNYTGGDTYPFMLNVSGKDSETGQAETVTVDLSIDTKTNKDSGTVNLGEGDNSGSFKFAVTPSNDQVKVAAPAGAVSVVDVLNQLGLGDEL